jgi:hypothetical protein
LMRRRADFWFAMKAALHGNDPDLTMSGSARVIYQRPKQYEQDGMDHTEVLSKGLDEHGWPTLDLGALHTHSPGGRIAYDPAWLHSTYPGADSHTLGKLDLVIRQMRYARRLLNARVHFVFVDDIYAEKLAHLLRTNASVLPDDTTLHLVAFESPYKRQVSLNATEVVTPRILYSPYRDGKK